MEIKGRMAGLSKDWESGRYQISFEVDEVTEGSLLPSVSSMKDKNLRVTVKEWRNKRSLSANAYAWVLLQKLAEALHTTKDEMYLECLKRYSGRFTHILCKENALEFTKSLYRAVEDLGEVTIGSMTGRQLRVYYGSSTFDTKEMSVFIDGIVSECKELGIETLSPKELERMKTAWK